MYKEELLQLVNINTGWHFSTVSATVEQIKQFELSEMHTHMVELVLQLSKLLNMLVCAKEALNKW